MLKKLILLSVVYQIGYVSFANASFEHLVQTDLSFLNGEVSNGSSSPRQHRFSLNLNYWYQIAPKSYLISDLGYLNTGNQDSLVGGESEQISLGVGYGYNFAQADNKSYQYGPSILVQYFNDLEDRNESYKFQPNVYFRYFLNNSNAFLTLQLGYFFTFFEELDDIDASGISSSLSVGIGF